MKTLLLAIAATGTIGFGLAKPASAEASQVRFSVNIGVPVVAHYYPRPVRYYHPYRPVYRYVPPHRHYYRHDHGRHTGHDQRWYHGPIHGGQVYGRAPAIKRIDINPRLQQR